MLKLEDTSPMSRLHDNHKKYNCADVEKLAQRYIDNQLNEEERRLFDEHLEYCLPCDKKIQFEFKLKEIVQAKAREPLSNNLSAEKIKSFLANLH